MYVPVRMFHDYVLNNTATTLYTATSDAVVRCLIFGNSNYDEGIQYTVTLERVSAPTTEFVRVYHDTVGPMDTHVENMELTMRNGDRLTILANGFIATNVFNVIVGGMVEA